jgi:hypothetical protein
MSQRKIREERDFSDALKGLFHKPEEITNFLEGAHIFFCTMAEKGKQISETSVYTKTVPDFPRKRYLVIYYTFDDNLVCLHNVKSFIIM